MRADEPRRPHGVSFCPRFGYSVIKYSEHELLSIVNVLEGIYSIGTTNTWNICNKTVSRSS